MHHRLVRMAPVTSELRSSASEVRERAQANLAARRDTGEHRITANKGRIDWYINLEGPGALSLEVGHHNTWSGEFVEGTRILRNALNGGV